MTHMLRYHIEIAKVSILVRSLPCLRLKVVVGKYLEACCLTLRMTVSLLKHAKSCGPFDQCEMMSVHLS